MDSPTAVVLALLGVIVAGGTVMVLANRRPGAERLVRGGFLVVLAVFIGMLGFYVTGGFRGIFN